MSDSAEEALLCLEAEWHAFAPLAWLPHGQVLMSDCSVEKVQRHVVATGLLEPIAERPFELTAQEEPAATG